MVDDRTKTALQDAAILFTLFHKSAWRSAHVIVGSLQVSISRAHGTRQVAAPAAMHPGKAEAVTVLTAPHLATIRRCAQAGDMVAAGESYATLEVLQRTSELTAEFDMVVVEQFGAASTLIEFGQPILAVLQSGKSSAAGDDGLGSEFRI